MNVSKGGSLELPCMKGVFPGPSNISWWRNKGDPVQFLVSSYSQIEINISTLNA